MVTDVAGTGPPFATGSLAARIERAEVAMIGECAAAAGLRRGADGVRVRRLGGGIAAYAGPGAPFNKIAGLGFEPLDEHALDEIEREFASLGAPLQAELATLADPAVGRLLTSRGYQLVGFENVLGRSLSGDREWPMPAGVDVVPASAGETPIWIDTVITAFLSPDVFDGPPSHEAFDRQSLEDVYADTVAGGSFERFLARRGGAVAGGASLRLHEGIAQLNGAATLPAHRRQGVQTALLTYRLLEAARRGCDLAVVTTQPGSKSQQNVQRFGFALLYSRAILVKA